MIRLTSCQNGTGIGLVHLAEKIAARRFVGLSVRYQNWAECQSEEDIIILNILFRRFFGVQFSRVGKEQVSFGINMAKFELIRIETI